jgi:hypothetical protein
MKRGSPCQRRESIARGRDRWAREGGWTRARVSAHSCVVTETARPVHSAPLSPLPPSHPRRRVDLGIGRSSLGACRRRRVGDEARRGEGAEGSDELKWARGRKRLTRRL